MDANSTVLITLMIVGIIELILLYLFWRFHLYKHIHHPVYKIRNPIFWMVSLIGSAIFVIMRCTIMYLSVNNQIQPDIFAAFSPLTLICLGFSFFFGRVLFLWYALKYQRYQQDALIQRHLSTEALSFIDGQSLSKSIDNKHEDLENVPLIYRYSNFFGQPSKIFPIIMGCLLILWAVGYMLYMLTNSTLIAGRIQTFCIAILLLTPIYLISSLWCCSKSKSNSANITNDTENDTDTKPVSFRDDFRFRLEMTLMLIGLLLSVFIFVILLSKYGDAEFGTPERSFGLMINTVVLVIGQLISSIIQIWIPYMTWKESMRRFTSNSKTSYDDGHHVVSLLDVLRHRYGFFLFVDQLVQELSFENLSFLIEIYQFKMCGNNVSNSRHGRFRTSIIKTLQRVNSNKSKATEAKGTENAVPRMSMKKVESESVQSQIEIAIAFEEKEMEKETGIGHHNNIIDQQLALPLEQVSESHSQSILSSASDDIIINEYSNKRGGADISYFAKLLQCMPWNELPISKSIESAKGDKCIQAKNIYDKYIDKNSYYAVNISSDSWHQIDENMNALLLSVEDEDDDKQSLLKLFDVSLPNIFANLEDSMTRFRYSKGFCILTGDDNNV